MRRSLRKTFRGRGFYLLGGTLCATVVLVMVACCAICLLTLGRATQQSSQAIDSAIVAYDLYQQGRSPTNNNVSDMAQILDEDGTLTALAADPQDEALRREVAGGIAAFEEANEGDASAVYVYLSDALNASGEGGAGQAAQTGGAEGLFLGSQDPTVDARTYDKRLSQVDVNALRQDGSTVARLLSLDGATWTMRVYSYAPGICIVGFYNMPDSPNLDAIEPIADMAETYFVDVDGNVFPVGSSDYMDAIDFAPIFTQEQDCEVFGVTHDGASFREYFHRGRMDGTAYVLITPDIAKTAFNQFTLVIVIAGAALVVLGCVAGLYLTRRIYEPLQRIISRLAPQGKDVRDEFQLIGFALQAMEDRLSAQDEVVSEFHLMRLLRGRAQLVEEGTGFFFAEPNREVALAVVRDDEKSRPHGDGDETVGTAGRQSPSSLAELVRAYLGDHGRPCALCEESGFVFAVVDGQGGGTAALFEGLVGFAKEQGALVSVFASNVHAGSAKLNLCYREAMEALSEGTRRRAFNKLVRYEKPAGETERQAGTGTGCATGAGEAADLVAYVRDNYRDPDLTAALLAERFGMSRTAVSRAFSKSGEGGFLDYLHGLRLDKAEELLRTTQMPLADVAASVGYGSALTMTRAFKRYRSTTPGAYRAGAGGDGRE